MALVELCDLLFRSVVWELDARLGTSHEASMLLYGDTLLMTSWQSLIGIGLNWWQAIVVIFLSQVSNSGNLWAMEENSPDIERF
jgi:hypothetical protein